MDKVEKALTGAAWAAGLPDGVTALTAEHIQFLWAQLAAADAAVHGCDIETAMSATRAAVVATLAAEPGENGPQNERYDDNR